MQGDEGQQHALDLAAFEDMQQRGGVHPLAVGDELQLAAAAQRGEDLLKAMSKLSGANCRVRSPGTPLATRNCHWV